MTLNLKLALLGLVTMSAAITLPACQSNKCCADEQCAEACKETRIELSEVPPAVMATIQREAPGGKIVEVEKCEMKGKTCYCAEVETGGKTWELCIDADGTLTQKKMEN